MRNVMQLVFNDDICMILSCSVKLFFEFYCVDAIVVDLLFVLVL